MPNIEIERKYIIKLPDLKMLYAMKDYSATEITQIYLVGAPGVTHRIRARKYSDGIVYTETKKIRIDKISAYEDEREISRDEFERLCLNRVPDSIELHKTRYSFEYMGRIFEIDVYPQWERTAILETELPTSDTVVNFPNCISVVREVSGDRSYSNASMSRRFPDEDII